MAGDLEAGRPGFESQLFRLLVCAYTKLLKFSELQLLHVYNRNNFNNTVFIHGQGSLPWTPCFRESALGFLKVRWPWSQGLAHSKLTSSLLFHPGIFCPEICSSLTGGRISLIFNCSPKIILHRLAS